MSGGVLQLVATGREDNVISDDPQITLFHSIFRRHVNFAKCQETLSFNTGLTFGKNATCVLRKNADYINRLTIAIDLPAIKLEYIPLTNQQLAILLAEYGITWTYLDGTALDVITYGQFLEVVGEITYINGIKTRLTNGMINDQVDNITRQLQKDDLFIQIINTVTQRYLDMNNTNVTDYIDDLMLELLHANRSLFINDTDYIDHSDYYNQYLYLNDYRKDLALLTPRGVVWLNVPRNIISFYDPIFGLPTAPSGNDRYVSSSNSRGWTTNIIYKFLDSRWNATIPNIYEGIFMDNGLSNMSAEMLYNMTGLRKVSKGFFSSLPTLPINPQIGDVYIYNGIGLQANNIFKWNGISWDVIVPILGNAYYIIGNGINQPASPSYYQTFVYYNGSTWITYVLEVQLLYDVDQWRKSIYEIYDPTTGLPTVSTPDSLGTIYLSSSTTNGWITNYLYVWDGWEWLEKAPIKNMSIYVENGDIHSENILKFDGFDWKTVSIPLPLFDYDAFRQRVYYELRDILFTDSNVKLLYGVENFNTIVIPNTSVLSTRTFFDNAIANEIEIIDTNSAVYKQVYNTFFDTSMTGNQDHVISVQTSLKTAMRDCIENIITVDINMQTVLYQRLQYVAVTSEQPVYYQFIYYQKYSYNAPDYTRDGNVFNVPRSMYTFPTAGSYKLWDYFGGYIWDIDIPPTAPDYVTYVKAQLLTLIGEQGGSQGTMYAISQDTRISSMYDEFFANTTTPYTTVLDTIKYTYPTDRTIYNLGNCMNILSTQVKGNLYLDIMRMWVGLEVTVSATKAVYWKSILDVATPIVNGLIPTVNTESFAESTICDTSSGLPSLMLDNERMTVFVFQKYTSYTVIDLTGNTTLQIPNQNPIEYLVLSFTESIKSTIISQNQIGGDNAMTTDELLLLLQHIDNLASAYLDTGLQSYSIFQENNTNITQATVPELFYPSIDFSYHLPYDGITSITCYLLNNMRNAFNTFYQNVTDQAIYDNIGNPLMTINEQFITSSNFYDDGNQMYLTGETLIQSLIDAYSHDLQQYDAYGNILRIKNLFIEPQKYKYTYPIETYVEIHKAIYNNQSIYINSTTTYSTVYTNVLTQLNTNMQPLLEFYNITNGIYMSPMDVLMESLDQRLSDLRINPYSSVDDINRNQWYDDFIIHTFIESAILDHETDFSPESVGLIKYFVNSINSLTNPFDPTMTLREWYDGIDRDKIASEITKMFNLFGLPYYSNNASNSNAITPQNLYNDMGNINNDYNGFATIKDFIQYMMDHIIKLSVLGNIVPLFKKTIQATSDELINFYSTEKSNYIDLLNKINPYTQTFPYRVRGLAPTPIKYSTLEDIIRNVYNKEPVNFAWIKELGHYLIDTIEFLIDDEVIDRYSGEYMHILASLESTASRIMGYAKMIGHVPELYTYNNTPKPSYRIFVPIAFTPCKFVEASLPLLCLQHSQVSIRVKFKQLTDVAYWAPLTHFIKQPKLKCSMIADYIFLDHEERMRIAPLKHEILMEQIQYNGDVMVNLSTEVDKIIRLCFTGMSKELFIVCQMDEYVNGTLPNGEKQWNNYQVSVPKNYLMSDGSYITETLVVDPIESMEIRFNGRQREALKDSIYYACAQKCEHHGANLYNGVHVYSFALYPENLQPSGAANAGKIGYIELYIKFNHEVIALVGKSKKTMRIGVYNKSENMLRIMSGLGGLAFYN